MGFARRPLARLVVPLAAPALVASEALSSRATAQEVSLERVHAMVPPSGAKAGIHGDWDGDGDPDLAENTLYWQAIVGSPPRLTNLELTRFSSL